jgi:hypothetical protein
MNAMSSGSYMRAVVGPLYPTVSELSALEEPDAWGVWLEHPGHGLSPEMLSVMFDAARPLEGIVWHVAAGAPRMPSIAGHQRALGRYPGLVRGDLISTQTVIVETTTWYGDIGIVNPDAPRQLASLWQRSTAATDSLVAFFRSPTARARKRWQVSVLGALWSWAVRQGPDPASARTDTQRRVLSSLVHDVLELDGILALIADVEESGRILILVARKDTCTDFASRIDTSAKVVWLSAPSDIGRVEWLPWLT